MNVLRRGAMRLMSNDPTPDSWVNVEADDTPLLQRCVEIMQTMSSRYDILDIDHRVRPWIAVEGGSIAYFLDSTHEIVLPYVFSPKQRMYDITTFGFLSNDVQGVLDLALAKLRKIIVLSGVSSTVFAGVPTTFDYAGMSQLLALLQSQPGVQVKVLPVAGNLSMWRITV